LESLGAAGQVSREGVKAVIDLTEQDFKDISNVTGCLFELEFIVLMVVFPQLSCPNSEFLKQDLRGKHSWLNASSAKDLSERVRHVFLLVQRIL
jgi:hypothetical protein